MSCLTFTLICDSFENIDAGILWIRIRVIGILEDGAAQAANLSLTLVYGLCFRGFDDLCVSQVSL